MLEAVNGMCITYLAIFCWVHMHIRVTNNLEEVGEELPKEYKDPLSAELHKQLEYEFHSCDYGGLMKVITALQTVCSHLKKV